LNRDRPVGLNDEGIGRIERWSRGRRNGDGGSGRLGLQRHDHRRRSGKLPRTQPNPPMLSVTVGQRQGELSAAFGRPSGHPKKNSSEGRAFFEDFREAAAHPGYLLEVSALPSRGSK